MVIRRSRRPGVGSPLADKSVWERCSGGCLRRTDTCPEPQMLGKRMGARLIRLSVSIRCCGLLKDISGAFSKEIKLPGLAGRFVARINVEFAVDALEVGLHRIGRNVQRAADLVVGVAAGQQAQHLELAFAQGVDKRLVAGGCFTAAMLGRSEGSQQPADELHCHPTVPAASCSSAAIGCPRSTNGRT